MQKRFLEIKSYWREESPASMPPDMAAWKAVEDFALWLHRNKKDERGEDDLLVDLAGSLFFKYPESTQDKIDRGDKFPGSKSLEPYHVRYLAKLDARR